MVQDIKTTPIEDKYDLGDELGRGKFGVVKKCVCKENQEEYAAKFIRKRKTRVGRGQKPEDIYREIEIMQALGGHPRVVSLENVFEDKTNIIMVMELLRGTELFAVLAKKDHFMETEAIDYMKQMLSGVAFIHYSGFIHLDLKPENVVLQDESCRNLKIIDFGLAQKYDPKATPKEIVGTPEFMAPETIAFDPVSPATDMWAVGVITYIMLSGCSPFLGDDDCETYGNITSGEVEFPEEYFNDLSPEVQDFICECLAPKPVDRLSAEKSLQHKWLAPKKIKNFKRIGTKRLRRFNAQRKWQEAIQAVLRTAMMARVVSYMQEMVAERSQKSNMPIATNEMGSKLERHRSTIILRDRSKKSRLKSVSDSMDEPPEMPSPTSTELKKTDDDEVETDLVKNVITVEVDVIHSRPTSVTSAGGNGTFDRQARKSRRLNRGQVRFRRAQSSFDSEDKSSLALPIPEDPDAEAVQHRQLAAAGTLSKPSPLTTESISVVASTTSRPTSGPAGETTPATASPLHRRGGRRQPESSPLTNRPVVRKSSSASEVGKRAPTLHRQADSLESPKLLKKQCAIGGSDERLDEEDESCGRPLERTGHSQSHTSISRIGSAPLKDLDRVAEQGAMLDTDGVRRVMSDHAIAPSSPPKAPAVSPSSSRHKVASMMADVLSAIRKAPSPKDKREKKR